jgi:flagellar biosynthesis/type III secretory pathway M-ring protein FliF/YscJ
VRALIARLAAREPRDRPFAFALVAGLALVLACALFLGRDVREPLFAAPLDPAQIAEVEERLAAWGIPFVAASDNLRVDPHRRNDLLLRLSLAGVPHAHLTTTSEALAKAGPLTPQSVLDAQALDGLAGDLALGLRGISGIDDARVILAPGRRATFADERAEDASGSVRLSLHPGTVLARETIEGIRSFVAAGVPGLRAERITILDDRGTALGERRSGMAEDAAELQASLQSALDEAFGAGATIVRVHVATDASARDVHDLRRTSLGGAIAATASEERFSAERKHYLKRQSNEDRGSDLHEERTQVPAGRIERISVAVMLDARRGLDAAKVRALAAATLGLETWRGDDVRVEAVAFGAPGRAGARGAPWFGLLAAIVPSVVFAVAALAALRWGGKPMLASVESIVAKLSVRRTSREVAGFPPAAVRGALRGEPPHTAAAIISALPTATATAVLELYPPEERSAIVRRMSRVAAPVVPDCETLLRG